MFNEVEIDLTTITKQEKEALGLALGVLRSDSDYADFLGSWLQDYGRKVLSPNPPEPLLPFEWLESLPEVIDAPNWIQKPAKQRSHSRPPSCFR